MNIFMISTAMGILASALTYLIKRPLPNVAKRLYPYNTVVRVRLNAGSELVIQNEKSSLVSLPVALEFFKPIYGYFLKLISKISFLDDEDVINLRLRQAGFDGDITKYRYVLAKRTLTGLAIGLLLGAGLANGFALVFFPCLFGFVALSKSKGKIDKDINKQCIKIRFELYTIDQLLALHIRTGSGVIQAIQSIALRTRGIVANDLNDILSRVRTGIAIDESLYIAAKLTPEPHASRTYKLLAAASNRGVDLTGGLLDLAKDLRRTLREEVKTTSAKRRAAMLIPTIGILAPIMLLFVAAPIPSIVLGGN